MLELNFLDDLDSYGAENVCSNVGYSKRSGDEKNEGLWVLFIENKTGSPQGDVLGRMKSRSVLLRGLSRFGILLGEREGYQVPGLMTYLVANLAFGSASSEGFLSLILLLVVIIALVVIVEVVIVVVVIGVVIVVGGVSFIVKLSFMVVGFLYRIVFPYMLY
ncbi:hypothetical protein Tco_1214632 [Tanacetum coccineum]